MPVVWDQSASPVSGPAKSGDPRRRVVADKTAGPGDTDQDAEDRDSETVLSAQR